MPRFLGEFWVQALENTRAYTKILAKKLRILRENAKNCVLFREIVHKTIAHNPKVVGSNPSSATKKPPILGGFSYFSELFEAIREAQNFAGLNLGY